MKKLLQTKYLITILFLLFLLVMYLLSLSPFLNGCRVAVWNLVYKNTINLSVVEQHYNDVFCGKGLFVTINGGFQHLIGAREVNERYQLDNGHITYVIDEYDMSSIGKNTVQFHNALKELDIPMVYVNAPFKINETDKQLPPGIKDYSNENANRFLAHLEDAGIPTLDLRQSIAKEGLDHYSLFYPSDHHWKAETGFWATGKIVNYITGLDNSFAVDSRIFDLSNYSQTVCKDVFLGSAGRRIGPLYTGFDDITLIEPNFITQLSFTVEAEDIRRQGNFSSTIFFMGELSHDDMFQSNAYSVYCGNDYGLLTVRNFSRERNLEPTCTGKKILLVKDSFSSVVIPFLSLAYEDVHVVDLRILKEDLMEHIRSYQPDLVLVLYNPGAYENNNLNMFEFLS